LGDAATPAWALRGSAGFREPPPPCTGNLGCATGTGRIWFIGIESSRRAPADRASFPPRSHRPALPHGPPRSRDPRLAGHSSDAGFGSGETEQGWGLPGALHPAQTGRRSAGSSNSPRDGGDARAVFIHKVPPRIENPAVVQGHQGVSGCGGVVLAVLAVRVLQGRKLVLAQHLVHHELPRGGRGARWSGRGNAAAPRCFGFSPARVAEPGPWPPCSPPPRAGPQSCPRESQQRAPRRETRAYLENWKMSKTNFSILMPLGFSGWISCPVVMSTCGIFFSATWCCSCGS